MTWNPSPELVERCERAPLDHALPRPGDIARTVLRAAVDSGELIPRERVEELRQAVTFYAKHTPLCAVTGGYRDRPCDCGRDYALALYTQEPKG